MYIKLFEDFDGGQDLRPVGYNRKATTGMNWIRQEKRLAIYIRDALKCVYCLDDVYQMHDKGISLTLDHVRPHIHSIKAGENADNTEKNLVTCCSTCNSVRQDLDIDKFIARFAEKTGGNVAEIRQRVDTALSKPLDMKRAKELIIHKGSTLAVIMSKHPDLKLEERLRNE